MNDADATIDVIVAYTTDLDEEALVELVAHDVVAEIADVTGVPDTTGFVRQVAVRAAVRALERFVGGLNTAFDAR